MFGTQIISTTTRTEVVKSKRTYAKINLVKSENPWSWGDPPGTERWGKHVYQILFLDEQTGLVTADIQKFEAWMEAHND